MKARYAPFILVSISMLLTGISADLFGTTVNVPGDYATIQAAINAARDGDVVNIAAGTYTEVWIEVNNSVTIQGQGTNATTVQAHAESGQAAWSEVFHVSGTMVTIKDMTIQHGQGGIVNSGTMTLTNCIVTDNCGDSGDGGICNEGGTMTLINCIVSDSFGGWGTPGIRNRSGGTATLASCTVCSNDLGIENGHGGSVFRWKGGTMALTNCTISNNKYAGICNWDGTTTLTNCTVNNNAGRMGGIFNEEGQVNVRNTIIADNTSSEGSNDIGGTIYSLDCNLIEDIGDATIEGVTTHNIYGEDPMLAPLADNGGFTQTCALQAGSPAINAGTDENAPFTDERGYGRYGAPDIGAYEYSGTTSVGQPATWGQIKAMFRFR